jgi:plasmid stabilization system protein ParE
VVHVIWTDPALEDLKRIGEYVNEQSPANAAALVERVLTKARLLSTFPLMGQIVPEFAYLSNPPREVLCDGYRIIYLADNDAVHIRFCVHGSRDLAGLLDPKIWDSV